MHIAWLSYYNKKYMNQSVETLFILINWYKMNISQHYACLLLIYLDTVSQSVEQNPGVSSSITSSTKSL